MTARNEAVMTAKRVRSTFKDLLLSNRINVSVGQGRAPSYIRVSSWGTSKEIPNYFRKIILEAIFGDTHSCLDLNNIKYGNIEPYSIALHPSEWDKVLSHLKSNHYGILE